MESDANREAQEHASNSIVIMVFTLISRLLGIVKARAIATVFGATGIADVINFTFNIPNNFRKLFAEGALSSAYIPVFSTSITEEKGGIEKSKALLARMQGFQLLFSLPLVLLTWIWRTEIILFLSDFPDPEHIQLSGKLLVYFMVFLGSISFAALYGGVLQSHGSFFTAAAAPLIFSVSVIASVYGLSSSMGPYSMAFGVVFGGTAQALVTFLRLRSYGYRMRFSFQFSSPDFRRVMHSWAPVTITAVVAIVTQQIAFYFASTLSEGTVTAFSNAIIIWQAPYGIFYSAIATVFFPAMVSAFTRRQRNQLDRLVHKGLVYIATFLIPSALLLTVLRNETTAVLLQSGRFVLEDTIETGTILFWFTVGMPIVAWYGFMQRVCFSTSRFKSTLTVGIVVAIVDVVITWMGLRLGYGSKSLSLANTISFGVGVIGLWFVAHQRGHLHISLSKLANDLVRLVLANIPLGTAAILYIRYMPEGWWHDGSTMANAALLLGLYCSAILIVLVSYRLVGIEFLSVLTKRKERRDN